jgi:hypothetical protein
VRQSRCAPALGKGLVYLCPALIHESGIEHSRMLSVVHSGVSDEREYFEVSRAPAILLIATASSFHRPLNRSVLRIHSC